jgi:hypothetical protein
MPEQRKSIADFQVPFHFVELPAEIRNYIYQELLCNFSFEDNALTRVLTQQNPPNGTNQATRPIDTSILRVNRGICREAYDVMVKTNRFVYISSIGVEMQRVLVRHQVPLVTINHAHAQQFRDYMMYAYIETTTPPRRKSTNNHFVCK